MLRRHFTRRHALRLGAAAVAAGVGPARAALGAPPALFEVPVPEHDGRARPAGGWRTTPVVRAPARFDLIGLRWRAGPPAAQVRARLRGGRWTEWAPLHPALGHAPDAGPAPAGSEPVFTGPADEFQLRVRGRASGLRARCVRAAPAARAARLLAPRPLGAVTPVPGQPPAIIPRAAWGADAVPPRAAPAYGSVQLAFVHHTVTANTYAPEQAAGIVLAIARYHRDSNRWNDIGYHFLVDRYGQIFEGRAGGIDQPVVGAQAQGYNTVSTGIACLGSFEQIAQSDPALEALAWVVGWKLSLHGVPVQGQVTVISAGGATNAYPAGAPVVFERISGHRDGDRTSCPGDALYAQLPDLRVRAARYVVQPPPPPAAPELVARAATTRLRGPQPLAVTGTLRLADGTVPAGAQVQVQYQPPAGDWTTIAASACAPDGSWGVQVRLPASGSLRAIYAADPAAAPVASTAMTVTVLPLLALALAPARVRAGGTLLAHGTCSPAPPDGRVEVVVERRRGARWVLVERRRVRLARTRFAVRLKLRLPGLHRVWVVSQGAQARRPARALRGRR